MSRASRLFDLVQLLGGHRRYTVADLAARFGVSERTMFRDLAVLEELRVPIVHEDGGYRLIEGATLRPLSLSPLEWSLLRLALDSRALRRSSTLARRLEILGAKLDALHPDDDAGVATLAGLDRSGALAGSAFSGLETAMIRHRSADIDYVSLRSGKRRWRRVDPWSLFHRAEAWYLLGWCHEAKEARTFRLDRVAAVRMREETFAAPEGFDLEEFLGHAWSLYRSEEPREMVIRFDAKLAPLVGNARHHEGERIERLPDGGLEYRVTLAHLEEIARWVVTFGGDAQAIAPPELVDRVAEIANGAAAAHERRSRKPARASDATPARSRPAAKDARGSTSGRRGSGLEARGSGKKNRE